MSFLKIKIHVNQKDESRCSISCRFCSKLRGIYTCTLTDDEVDTGEDDEIGYGFKRTEYCLKSSIEGLENENE